MKKKHYIIYVTIVAILYIFLPLGIIVSNRIFQLTEGELMGLIYPVAILLFFGTIGAGVLSENIKD